MKNWQDYVTNVDTNERPKAKIPSPSITNPAKTQSRTPPSPIFRIWFTINVILTALCIIALYYGISRTTIEHSGIIGLIRNTAITFYLPSMLIAGILGGGYLDESYYTQAQASSNILTILLITNFILTLIFYYRHRQDNNPSLRINVILSIAPVILIIMTVLAKLF